MHKFFVKNEYILYIKMTLITITTIPSVIGIDESSKMFKVENKPYGALVTYIGSFFKINGEDLAIHEKKQ